MLITLEGTESAPLAGFLLKVISGQICPGQNSPLSAIGRLCCKSRFALVIKISAGYGRGFRVKM
jgi:hypothetical protein